MLNEAIAKLVQYGLDTGLVPASEKIYATNLLLECMKEDEYTEPEWSEGSVDLEETLRELLDEAVARGLIEDNIVSRDSESCHRLLLQIQPGHGLYPPLPAEKGSKMEGREQIWRH